MKLITSSLLSLFFFLFTLLLFATCSTEKSKNKNVKITIAVDSIFCTEDQWVYMFYQRGYNHSFEDSAKIGKNKRTATLYGFTEEQEEFELFFEKNGPNQLFVIASPGDDLFVKVKEEDGIGRVRPEIEGSSVNNERAKYNKYAKKATFTLFNLEGNIYAYQDADSSFLQTITDSIEAIYKELAERNLTIIKTSEHPKNVWSSLHSPHLEKYVGKDSVYALIEESRKRFPNYKNLQNLYKPYLKDTATEESKKNFKRRLYLMRNKGAKARKKKENQQADNNDTGDLTGTLSNKLPELQGRDALIDFSLESNDSSRVVLSQLRGKYVLVDFWASWCIPCLEEIPIIKRAYSDYGDKLVICLVSIDVNHLYWRDAIKLHKLEHFVNVSATNREGEMDEAIKRLDIKTIPANYLLDGKGNIIAKDIRGHELLELLDKHLGDN